MTEQKATDLIKIVKLVPGTLILAFQNALEYSQERQIVIDATMDFYRLPLSFVVSMFQIHETMGFYRGGYFTFSKEDKEKVFKYAEELQLYFPNDGAGDQSEQPEVLMTDKQIAQAITLGRLKEITAIVEQGTKPQKQLLIAAARDNVGKLKLSTIQYLEEKLGVQISEGDE